MTKKNTKKLAALKIRLHQLKNNGKNDDSPGVIKKIEREIRYIEKGA